MLLPLCCWLPAQLPIRRVFRQSIPAIVIPMKLSNAMKKFCTLSLLTLMAIVAMAQSFPEKVYLTGSATPVGWETSKLSMFNNGDGTYEYVGMLYNSESGNEFKMLGAADWLPSYGPQVSATAIAVGENYDLETRTDYEMDDQKFTVPFDGRYHLTLSLVENKLYVDTAAAELADLDGNAQVPVLYLVGNGCGAGWESKNAIAATTLSENVFTITTTIYGHTAEEEFNELKFLSSQSWAMPQVGPAEDGEEFTGAGTYTASLFFEGDKKWHNTTTETKDYTFTIDLNAGTMEVAEYLATGLDEHKLENAKCIINGQLYIIHNEKIFTITGARVR